MIWTFGVGAVMKSGLKNDDDFYGKSTFFVKTFYYWWSYMHILNSWFHGTFSSVIAVHTAQVSKHSIKHDQPQKFPWNQLCCNFFSKKRWFDGKMLNFP